MTANFITNPGNESITSMEVSQMVSKAHCDLMRDIRRYISQLAKSKIAFSDFFTEATYKDSSGKENTCFDVTRKGCEFIANKLTGQKGTEFTARYVNRFHELQENNISSSFINALTSITESMDTMSRNIDSRLSALELSQQKKSSPASKYSRWKTNVFNKMKLIQSYVNDNSDQELTLPLTMKIIFDELQDTYDIDLPEYTEMYKCEYGLDFDTKIQTLDVINHYKDIRDMFTLTLDSILDKLHLKESEKVKFHKNIFDELATQLENQQRIYD